MSGAQKKDRYGILVIDPESTFTRVAIFAGNECFCEQTLQHTASALKKQAGTAGQLDLRLAAIDGFLHSNSIDGSSLNAIAGKVGLLRPLQGGVYEINDKMLDDLRSARYGDNISNLGALLAHEYSVKFKIPAYTIDPGVDSPDDTSKIDVGQAKSRLHYLNMSVSARRCAAELGKDIQSTRFVIVQLGGGISVCAMQGGRIIDSIDAPHGEMQVKEFLSKKSTPGGFYGIDQLPDVFKLVDSGNAQAGTLLDSMVRQTAKWIGGMSAVLAARPTAIILTGDMANSSRLVAAISHYVNHMGPVKVYAGEFEMQALAEGVLQVLRKEQQALDY